MMRQLISGEAREVDGERPGAAPRTLSGARLPHTEEVSLGTRNGATLRLSPFGMRLRKHRVEAGLTQAELAERARLSTRVISDLERGVIASPRTYTFRQLAEALELSDDERVTLRTCIRPARPAPDAGGHRPLQALPDPQPGIHAFLIADVRNYTRFTEQHGDDEAARLAARFADVVEEIAALRKGRLVELRGDECLAVFTSARQALMAALEMQARFAEESARDPSLPFSVGIGLDVGEAVPVRGGYRGGALNRAARMQALTQAGEIFVTDTIMAVAGAMQGVAYTRRGRVRLKGIAHPANVIQVTSSDGPPATHTSGSALPKIDWNLLDPSGPEGCEEDQGSEVARVGGDSRSLIPLTDTWRADSMLVMVRVAKGGSGADSRPIR